MQFQVKPAQLKGQAWVINPCAWLRTYHTGATHHPPTSYLVLTTTLICWCIVFIGLHLYNVRLISVLISLVFLSLKCPFRSTIEKIRLHEFPFSFAYLYLSLICVGTYLATHPQRKLFYYKESNLLK